MECATRDCLLYRSAGADGTPPDLLVASADAENVLQRSAHARGGDSLVLVCVKARTLVATMDEGGGGR